jgi:predicted NAD-dependent protein-ADP-ribosyltransferase YbiA (DUF1768 family)
MAEAPKKKIIKRLAQPTTIEAYWRAKDKRPDLFTYTDKGDLKAPPTDDLPEKIFPLPTYRPTTLEETEEAWAVRQSLFDPIYESIETAKDGLRAALAAYAARTGTEKEVVVANQNVAVEEAKLTMVRSPLRWIDESYENPTTNTIVLENRYEVRKLGYPVFVTKRFGVDLETLIKPLNEAEEAAAAAIRAGELAPGDLHVVVTNASPLGLQYPFDLKVGDTTYYTAFTAIFGEVAKQSGNQELFQTLLGTRSVRTVRNLTRDFTSQQITTDIIDRVIDAAAEQIPNFREALLKTGDQPILYATNTGLDPVFTVGLDEKSDELQRTNRWAGENLWGKALVRARTRFRELAVTGVEVKPVATEASGPASITEGQQQQAKTGAIIGKRMIIKKSAPKPPTGTAGP